MNSRRLRRRRSWAQFAAVGRLLVGASLAVPACAVLTLVAPPARANPQVVAVRGVPSSLSAEFGPVASFGGGGVIVAPTRSGVDLYDLAQPGAPLLGRFRTAGAVLHASPVGSTLFLVAGAQGVLAVDASDPAAPALLGSIGNLGRVAVGAAVPGVGILAAVDSTLHFVSWNPGSGFALRRSVTFGDGRRVAAMASQGDSFLVASNRSGAPSRLILTLYRWPSGAAAPDSIAEFAFNGHRGTDIAWSGSTAFVADGNLGILVVNVPGRAITRSVAVQGTQLVRSVSANDSVVVAAAEGRTLVRFARLGASGDSLGSGSVRILEGDPAHVRLSGDLAVASTFDQIAVTPPDETGWSLLEFVSVSGGPEPASAGGLGRVRRVAVADGLAYVADYTGGLRIYRAGGSDSSLVGVSPAVGNARPVDVALDPDLPLAYLASGPAGFEVVGVGDPSAPDPKTSIPLPGLATAVVFVQPGTVAVAYRGIAPGVTFFQIEFNDVDSSVIATARGSVGSPFVQDPRALAARDTILFVADDLLGVVSIGFGNLDLPAAAGPPSAQPARDLDLLGTRLLVATRSNGLQIVDVATPRTPILRGEFATPPLLGVTQNGSSAVVFLGEDGALVVDIGAPAAPFARGPIAVPGTARDGFWIGDTLLVAASLGLERFRVSPAAVTVAALQVDLDPDAALATARITWAPVTLAGVVGLNLYRDLGTGAGAQTPPSGRRVTAALLPPSAVEAADDSIVPGQVHRYRLEAVFADGSSVKVAEGSLAIPSASRVGRPYPNPYRPGVAGVASIPYRVPVGSTATLILRVFDARGRLVREISAPAQAPAGFGAMTWDGRDRGGRRLPTGIYFLRLTGAGLDDSRAVTLVR